MGARLAVTAILALAAALRVWRLDQNGVGNECYSAGLGSMSASWHNFLYHAFDPAGFLSVNKPPVTMYDLTPPLPARDFQHHARCPDHHPDRAAGHGAGWIRGPGSDSDAGEGGGRLVPSSQWRAPATVGGAMQLYDLRPASPRVRQGQG